MSPVENIDLVPGDSLRIYVGGLVAFAGDKATVVVRLIDGACKELVVIDAVQFNQLKTYEKTHNRWLRWQTGWRRWLWGLLD